MTKSWGWGNPPEEQLFEAGQVWQVVKIVLNFSTENVAKSEALTACWLWPNALRKPRTHFWISPRRCDCGAVFKGETQSQSSKSCSSFCFSAFWELRCTLPVAKSWKIRKSKTAWRTVELVIQRLGAVSQVSASTASIDAPGHLTGVARCDEPLPGVGQPWHRRLT